MIPTAVDDAYNAVCYLCGFRGRGAFLTEDAVTALCRQRAHEVSPEEVQAALDRAEGFGLLTETDELKDGTTPIYRIERP